MDSISLATQSRDTSQTARALRRGGIVPCVVYGNDIENTVLQCDAIELLRVYRKAGESTLVDLDVSGKNVPVLFHAVELDAVSYEITHVDFYAVDMNKEVETSVHVVLEGESPAVKNLGGVLVTVQDHVTVRCLPKNLPHDLRLDISSLEELSTSLTVAELPLPEGVEVTDGEESVLVTIHEPRKVTETTEAEEGEAEGEEKKEGEEGGEEKKEE